MAQVARTTNIDIDWLLDYLTREWSNVRDVAAAWSTWDQESRIDYLNEWPITESYEEVLRAALSQTRLTADQAGRYRHLLELINESRPTIEDMLDRG
jgi:hypothetical protein